MGGGGAWWPVVGTEGGVNSESCSSALDGDWSSGPYGSTDEYSSPNGVWLAESAMAVKNPQESVG